MEKQFKLNQGLGWNWHKSWNLPGITLNLEVYINYFPLQF